MPPRFGKTASQDDWLDGDTDRFDSVASKRTVLDLEPRGDAANPRLTTYVYIDDRAAAALARLLIASFGFLADRKLGEGLRVTTEVAEWAVDRSGGFCEWLAR